MRINSVNEVSYYNFNKQNNSRKSYTTPALMTDTISFGSNVVNLRLSEKINRQIKLINKLVTKRIDSLNLESARMNFKDYELPVHNPKLAPYIKESYTPKSFGKLFKQAEDKGVFKFQVDEKTGFVKTSDIQSHEDPKMADLVWVTDTCKNMEQLERYRPELCTKAVESLSSFYRKEQPEFDDVIAHPEIFKNNTGWSHGGVGHAFNKNTNEPHRDFPRTRLESMGHYLQRTSKYIMSGLDKEKNYGYKTAEDISDNTINAISSCVKYLKAIDYPQAHSCGAWEEKTFKTSLTSDTAIINEGFRRVLKMMYGKTDNPELLKVRERIFKSQHGDVFNDEGGLNALKRRGEERLIMNHLVEAPGERELDAAMSFATHYKYGKMSASDNVIDDINENVKLLEALEGKPNSHGLVGEHGIKRYLYDEYKNLNYDLPDKKGKLNENHDAQWFMVSDVATGYGIQLQKLIIKLNREQRTPNKEEQMLMDKLLKKETEYINRSYARITGRNLKKANGKDCPENKTPEAFQAITDDYNNVKYVPGTNTPLAWAQSSLLKASKVYTQNLKELEKMGYFKNEFLIAA